MDQKPLVSIVTPLYNCEKYISQCIESVLEQTYKNFEYIIVNNVSTDNSAKIINSYARKDSRIKIINNEIHLNLMPNWNHAMRQISKESKYCKVIHADDWLYPQCIESMVTIAETDPTIGVVSSYRYDENKTKLSGPPISKTTIAGKIVGRMFLIDGLYFFGSPSTTFYRSDLVRCRENFFNEDNFHADTEICFDLLRFCNCGFVHQILSFTRRHNESETTFAKFYETYYLGKLEVLIKFGNNYLNVHEFNSIHKKYVKNYYRRIGRQLYKIGGNRFRGREINFISYHRTALTRLGLKFDWIKLIISMFVVIYNYILKNMMIK
jgi:glycosyltransferase involved in cell wall biosynthesis